MLNYLHYAPVAFFILSITVVTSIMALTSAPGLMDKFILSPYRVVHYKEYYRIFTCTLIHADWGHLLFNMVTFYSFALPLERYYLGHGGFLILYLVSTLGSHIPTILRHKDNDRYLSLGASGAVSGVIFSFILFDPIAELGVFFILPLQAWIFAILYLIYTYFAGRAQLGRINHSAHLWGALTGIVITAALQPGVIGSFALFMKYRFS